MVQYWYDAWGNHKVVNSSGAEITDPDHIGNLNPFRYRGYYYDRETGLYFLQTRYYDPEIGRFLNRDSVAYADPETINGLNLYAYCLNNPIEYVDPTGTMSDLLKWIIGGVTFVGAIGLTLITGGSLFPVILGMTSSILISGVAEGAIAAANGGDFAEGFASGAADGALWGGVFSLGGAMLRTAKILTKGITIGESMTRVANYANSAGQAFYKGMPGYNLVRFFKGETVAHNLALAHNKAFIKRMMRWGVTITDIGMDIAKTSRSSFYMIENSLTQNYTMLIRMLMLHY